MGQQNFTFESEFPDSHQACATSCPLAKIPAEIWLKLLRPPFRRRHPFIFWLMTLLFVFAAFMVMRHILADDEETGDQIALLEIQGAIMNPGPTLAWIRKIENNPSVKGVLVRVDSPGGGAAASQEIYASLARVAGKLPVAVSMGATAASGGLMVSMAGQRIFANPSTVTGSIGVRMDIPQLQGLMEKIGVGQETLVTAPYKDAASYTHPLSQKDRAYLESVIMDMHRQFVDIVAKGRHMAHEKAVELASGKIFTGQEALSLGLVDALGGQDEALDWLCKKTGIPATKKLLTKPAQNRRLLERLLAMAGVGIPDHINQLGSLAEAWTRPAFLYQ